MSEHLSNPRGLYHPQFERENCGFGLIAHRDGLASHYLVDTAISSLARMTHRGAVAADGKSGDGCGLLLGMPQVFMRAKAAAAGIKLSPQFAVGMIFFPDRRSSLNNAKDIFEQAIQDSGLNIAGWLQVAVEPRVCGEEAMRSKPQIMQVFVNSNGFEADHFERRLFVARRRAELQVQDPEFHVCSLSARVISYKGLVMPKYLPEFFADLSSDQLTSHVCVFHQRFSTNTLPQWKLAQPFRLLAHNGEINTIQGNRNWACARAHNMWSPEIPELAALQPLVSSYGSDSLSLDNMLETLTLGGMDLFRATRILMPPAWQNIDHMDVDLRAFFEFYSMHMEPWDGPAGVVMSDGRYAACVLDRNGLRPARYVLTKDRHITLASEIGVYDYRADQVETKGRLKPGQMLAVDTETGELLSPENIDLQLRERQPYAEWLGLHARHLNSSLSDDPPTRPLLSDDQLAVYQKLFQVSFEERDQILRVLAEDGQEAVGSMGDDTPLPALSAQHRSIYDYFRQQFAQVTNPPIDPLRESIVMSLETCFGAEQNIFAETSAHAKRLIVRSPVLSERKLNRLRSLDDEEFASAVLDLNYDPSQQDLPTAISKLCDRATGLVKQGTVVLILSDRGIAKGKLPIHALLATGAVHHQLISAGLRCNANIIVETATARDPHHFAVLIGYGATAVYPYLAFDVIGGLVRSKEIRNASLPKLFKAYRQGINKGLYKIISKMGISTIASYRGAQLFEIVGLHQDVVETCFKSTPSRIQGTQFTHLEADIKALADSAWDVNADIHHGGLLKFVHGGEYHAFNPDVVFALQTAVASGESSDYRSYAELVNQRPITVVRDLLEFSNAVTPIPVAKVEPIEDILCRFDSAGMSLGALSPEAHETLAIAMNRIGGRSNSGEGGEAHTRYGTERSSKIKQVASGRFGVTPYYLRNAEVLQIKIAQGAKPGEGGQLPGHKVNETIAKLRHSSPGVALISPPPHHDIYSIEDLAQLIFDLKQVNPEALVSVKLVAEAGVGTVAAGVAKAYADLITIAGYDGGTGASPLTSVKYAGSPWELGLSETHQILRANNLRSKIRLQADGGLKTGRDVVIAAILGAESFGFGTAPMIAMGCKYLRICHLNNCATGVATQHKVLRLRHFRGDVEKVVNFFRFIAQDVREILAQLGITRLVDLIGRTDLLVRRDSSNPKHHSLDLSRILSDGGVPDNVPRYCEQKTNPPFDKAELAKIMLHDALPAIEAKQELVLEYSINNTDRSIGARLSGEIAKRYGDLGLENHPITLKLRGTAGQSLGVWNAGGLHIYVEGDANDYVGKGMAGGKLVLRPPINSSFASSTATIMGNTCLYGATGGRLYAAGTAGERFAVRNSGAIAVLEGIGDHGCEYMTGGVVAVLGETGVNFGAGMTGGFAYVFDQSNQFVDRYNHEFIDIHRVHTEHMEAYRDFLRQLVVQFVGETNSTWGKEILRNFYRYARRFWLVKPKASELDSLMATLKKAA